MAPGPSQSLKDVSINTGGVPGCRQGSCHPIMGTCTCFPTLGTLRGQRLAAPGQQGRLRSPVGGPVQGCVPAEGGVCLGWGWWLRILLSGLQRSPDRSPDPLPFATLAVVSWPQLLPPAVPQPPGRSFRTLGAVPSTRTARRSPATASEDGVLQPKWCVLNVVSLAGWEGAPGCQ
ncbi:hypothetical protein AAY473_015959 [Plecturocebus cupreus]